MCSQGAVGAEAVRQHDRQHDGQHDGPNRESEGAPLQPGPEEPRKRGLPSTQSWPSWASAIFLRTVASAERVDGKDGVKRRLEGLQVLVSLEHWWQQWLASNLLGLVGGGREAWRY